MAEKKATKTTAKKTAAKKAPAKKPEATKAPAKKAVAKKAPAKKPAAKKPAKKAARSQYTAEQLYTMVETAAYFAAVNDGFQKDPSSYWLQAEKEVNG
ncbi:MAG: DUF2934 domain-containing protein [Kiritimatiellales bacterium]|nr:DUF2934 domain-containing protein [Kiritimatiellales bacterium]